MKSKTFDLSTFKASVMQIQPGAFFFPGTIQGSLSTKVRCRMSDLSEKWLLFYPWLFYPLGCKIDASHVNRNIFEFKKYAPILANFPALKEKFGKIGRVDLKQNHAEISQCNCGWYPSNSFTVTSSFGWPPAHLERDYIAHKSLKKNRNGSECNSLNKLLIRRNTPNKLSMNGTGLRFWGAAQFPNVIHGSNVNGEKAR